MEIQSGNRTIDCVNILMNGGCVDDLPKEITPGLSDVLNEYIGQSNKAIMTIAELSGINNATMHKILNGNMHPTRNTLLCLAFTLKMPFEATQVLLKAGNRSSLSGGRKRDQIIMAGIIQKKNLGDVCTELTEKGYHDLSSRNDF